MPSRLTDRIRSALAPIWTRSGLTYARGTPLSDRYLGVRFGYEEEPEIKRAVRMVRTHTMGTFERMASLWQQVRYLDRYAIAGALVECGVWRGGSVGMMALAHLRSEPTPNRRLHLFDSFEGLPEPTAEDGAKAATYAGGRTTGALDPIGACVGDIADNRELLVERIGYPDELLSFHEGWFQDTLPRDAEGLGEIALLRLDGDWYESTGLCLEHLYAQVVRGGVVIVDDYGHWEGARRAVDEFLATRSEPVLLQHLDYTARAWLKTT